MHLKYNFISFINYNLKTQTFHLKYFVRNKRNLNENNCIRHQQLKKT